MKKKTIMHGAMAELLSKSNEAQINDKEPSSVRDSDGGIAKKKTPETENINTVAQQRQEGAPMRAPQEAQPMPQAQPMMQAQQMPKAQPMPQAQQMPQAQPMAQAQQMPKAQPMAQTQQMPKSQPMAQTQQMPKAQPMAQTQQMPKAQPMAQAQQMPKAQPMAQTQQMPKAQPMAQTQQMSRPQPMAQTQQMPRPQPMDQTGALRVQTIKENQATTPVAKPQNIQNGRVAPMRNTPMKRRKAKKSIWKKALGFVASALIIGAGVVVAVVMATNAKATIIPETVVGVELEVPNGVAEFKSKSSDDKKHDGRNYVTINIFEGEEMICSTGASTVGKVLEDMNVTIEGDYVLRENESDSITSDKVISIDKVTYGTITEQTSVPYETKYVDVQTIARGRTKLVRAGANGVSTATFKVTYVNGVETERVLESQVITTQPTSQIVNRGVGGTITIGGKTYSYSYYIDCKTTVYTGGGITASGLPATEKVIAVDPRVIPLGTSVYVSDPYCYVGFRTAADTGGAIKGNFIDIYMDEDNPYLWGYGVRSARVYILD